MSLLVLKINDQVEKVKILILGFEENTMIFQCECVVGVCARAKTQM